MKRREREAGGKHGGPSSLAKRIAEAAPRRPAVKVTEPKPAIGLLRAARALIADSEAWFQIDKAAGDKNARRWSTWDAIVYESQNYSSEALVEAVKCVGKVRNDLDLDTFYRTMEITSPLVRNTSPDTFWSADSWEPRSRLRDHRLASPGPTPLFFENLLEDQRRLKRLVALVERSRGEADPDRRVRTELSGSSLDWINNTSLHSEVLTTFDLAIALSEAGARNELGEELFRPEERALLASLRPTPLSFPPIQRGMLPRFEPEMEERPAREKAPAPTDECNAETSTAIVALTEMGDPLGVFLSPLLAWMTPEERASALPRLASPVLEVTRAGARGSSWGARRGRCLACLASLRTALETAKQGFARVDLERVSLAKAGQSLPLERQKIWVDLGAAVSRAARVLTRAQRHLDATLSAETEESAGVELAAAARLVVGFFLPTPSASPRARIHTVSLAVRVARRMAEVGPSSTGWRHVEPAQKAPAAAPVLPSTAGGQRRYEADPALLERLLATPCDQVAWRALYTDVAPKMHGMVKARHFDFSHEDVEDVVQDAFVSLLGGALQNHDAAHPIQVRLFSLAGQRATDFWRRENGRSGGRMTVEEDASGHEIRVMNLHWKPKRHAVRGKHRWELHVEADCEHPHRDGGRDFLLSVNFWPTARRLSAQILRRSANDQRLAPLTTVLREGDFWLQDFDLLTFRDGSTDSDITAHTSSGKPREVPEGGLWYAEAVVERAWRAEREKNERDQHLAEMLKKHPKHGGVLFDLYASLSSLGVSAALRTLASRHGVTVHTIRRDLAGSRAYVDGLRKSGELVA